VDSTLRQVDELRPSCSKQCREQIVGLYPIVSPRGLNDSVVYLPRNLNGGVVDLHELFWVVGTVILVNGPRLELVRLGDLPE
jgi:hypothetical protein